MAYLLDANVFIQAKNLHYGLDFCPAFWEWLIANNALQLADYYLVAQALAHHHTVVTHEIVSNSPKKIKIPNACLGLNIKFVTPFEMLRRERARFILGQSA